MIDHANLNRSIDNSLECTPSRGLAKIFTDDLPLLLVGIGFLFLQRRDEGTSTSILRVDIRYNGSDESKCGNREFHR